MKNTESKKLTDSEILNNIRGEARLYRQRIDKAHTDFTQRVFEIIEDANQVSSPTPSVDDVGLTEDWLSKLEPLP